MTRSKLKLEYITDDAKRRSTFKKRQVGLLKKTSEISTLCGVEVCTIIFGPDETQPGIYPPTRFGVQSVINRFRGMSQMDQSKKMLDHPTFMKCRITKATELLERNVTDNQRNEKELFLIRCLGGPACFNNSNNAYNNNLGANDLLWAVEEKLKNIEWRRQRERQQQQGIPPFVANGGAGGVFRDGSALAGGHHGQAGMMNMMQNNFDAGVQQQNLGGFGPNYGAGGNGMMRLPMEDNLDAGVQQQNWGVYGPNNAGGGNGMMRLLMDENLDDGVQLQDWGLDLNNGGGGNEMMMMPNNFHAGVQQQNWGFDPNNGAGGNGMMAPYGNVNMPNGYGYFHGAPFP